MSKVKAKITGVSTKLWKDKTLYSFVTDQDKWYRTMEGDPTAFKGKTVEFEFSTDKRGNQVVDVDAIEVVESTKKSPVVEKSSSRPQSNAGLSREEYWANKELRDLDNNVQYNYRAAHAGAVEYANLILTHGLLPKTGKNKPTIDLVDALIEDKAAELFRTYVDIEGLRDLEQGGVVEREAEEVDPYSAGEEEDSTSSDD